MSLLLVRCFGRYFGVFGVLGRYFGHFGVFIIGANMLCFDVFYVVF